MPLLRVPGSRIEDLVREGALEEEEAGDCAHRAAASRTMAALAGKRGMSHSTPAGVGRTLLSAAFDFDFL